MWLSRYSAPYQARSPGFDPQNHQAWRCIPANPSTSDVEAGALQIQSYPRLSSKFKASLEYLRKLETGQGGSEFFPVWSGKDRAFLGQHRIPVSLKCLGHQQFLSRDCGKWTKTSPPGARRDLGFELELKGRRAAERWAWGTRSES